jgi:hypothetical protein
MTHDGWEQARLEPDAKNSSQPGSLANPEIHGRACDSEAQVIQSPNAAEPGLDQSKERWICYAQTSFFCRRPKKRGGNTWEHVGQVHGAPFLLDLTELACEEK